MRPVGQMAFTNYLMQSLLVGLFFYGIGLGYYGKLQTTGNMLCSGSNLGAGASKPDLDTLFPFLVSGMGLA
ncbi:MAG: DUF418 domain-containing protein [Chitinophagaceae bacterium]|nr:DUF418 domain-containing protein [Chitinophagaceae bacterium]